MPSLIIASNGDPLRIDWPTLVLDQAVILPSRKPPRKRWTNKAR